MQSQICRRCQIKIQSESVSQAVFITGTVFWMSISNMNLKLFTCKVYLSLCLWHTMLFINFFETQTCWVSAFLVGTPYPLVTTEFPLQRLICVSATVARWRFWSLIAQDWPTSNFWYLFSCNLLFWSYKLAWQASVTVSEWIDSGFVSLFWYLLIPSIGLGPVCLQAKLCNVAYSWCII